MKVSIHQPHYFPWLGYFDKIAKTDRFVMMDTVQMEDRSYMLRNRFLNRSGEIVYLSVTASKQGYRDKEYRQIETKDNAAWQGKHRAYFFNTYRYAPHYEEIMRVIEPVFEKDYRYLFDVTRDSIALCMELLDIQTELVLQSALICDAANADGADTQSRRSNDVMALCRAAGATAYMTGTGASLTFLDREAFLRCGIPVAVQQYECPTYEQRFSEAFVPNISALDLLFNCGIERSRTIFWDNVRRVDEFSQIPCVE